MQPNRQILARLGRHAASVFALAAAASQATGDVTFAFEDRTWTGFSFTSLTSGFGSFGGSLIGLSVNATLNASSNFSYADDLCVYIDYDPLSTGGLLQVGGFTSLNALERRLWRNGGSSAPGTTVIDTQGITTPIPFAGKSSDPVIWLGNGYNYASTVGNWTGAITLHGIFALPTDCDANGVSDQQQVADGELSDCDGDTIPDLCEGAVAIDRSETFAFSSTAVSEVVFSGLPGAYQGTPRIEIHAVADLGAANDALIVQLDGGPGTAVFLSDGTNCPSTPDVAVIERTVEQFSALVADGELQVRVSGIGAVDTANCPEGGVTIRLVYVGLPAADDCNGNHVIDNCEISLGSALDCNGNRIPDSCDILSGVELDCNGNATPDSCEIATGAALDCNVNGVIDACEIASGGEMDCNANGVPDSCDLVAGAPDCNRNSIPDPCDIASGASVDIDANAIPDDCQPDCDADGVPDSYELAEGIDFDCNRNGFIDRCDIAVQIEPDCDGNGVPDSCDLAEGVSDCNDNGVRDSCDIGSGVSQDIDANGIPDECKTDCDADGLPDAYELANGLDGDCDVNGVIDWCDIVAGALDDDDDRRLDACESARGDFNLDGVVDGADLAPLLSLWGTSSPPVGDLDGDGVIGGADLSILLGNWGPIAWSPLLSTLSPRSGTVLGGTVVILRGAGLGGATSVRFGGLEATSVTTLDSATLSVVTPSRTAGVVSIEVATPGGTVLVPGLYRYRTAVPAWATEVASEPDPSVIYDAGTRAAILATGWSWKVRHAATSIEMLLIPPGTYAMGCSPSTAVGCFASENPVHSVAITQPFYMSRTEVTQRQWALVTGSNPSYFQSPSAQVPQIEIPNRPVERVSWNAIQGFLAETGLRLPTEAEWEYAYRAGTTTAFHGSASETGGTNDDGYVGDIAWIWSNSNTQSRPVGGKAANGFGLHDMSGNVSEWVQDWWLSTYYASSPTHDPQGPASGSLRVIRGGSAVSSTGFVRSSSRNGGSPSSLGNFVGFRVVRAPN